MEMLFSAESWASPGGTGFFIVCIGIFLYLVTSINIKKE